MRTNGDGAQHGCQVGHILVQHGQVAGQRRAAQDVARCGSMLLVQVAQLWCQRRRGERHCRSQSAGSNACLNLVRLVVGLRLGNHVEQHVGHLRVEVEHTSLSRACGSNTGTACLLPCCAAQGLQLASPAGARHPRALGMPLPGVPMAETTTHLCVLGSSVISFAAFRMRSDDPTHVPPNLRRYTGEAAGREEGPTAAQWAPCPVWSVCHGCSCHDKRPA